MICETRHARKLSEFGGKAPELKRRTGKRLEELIMSKRSGSQPEPRDASTRGAEEAGSRPNTDGIDGLRMEPELMLDLARKAAELVVERIEPAFLTGFRREEPETPSGQGARPEGTGGVLLTAAPRCAITVRRGARPRLIRREERAATRPARGTRRRTQHWRMYTALQQTTREKCGLEPARRKCVGRRVQAGVGWPAARECSQ